MARSPAAFFRKNTNRPTPPITSTTATMAIGMRDPLAPVCAKSPLCFSDSGAGAVVVAAAAALGLVVVVPPTADFGDEDWPDVLKALAEIGYNGWATAEVKGGGPKELKDVAERMNKVLGL